MKRFLKKVGSAAIIACMALGMMATALAVSGTVSKDLYFNNIKVSLDGKMVVSRMQTEWPSSPLPSTARRTSPCAR